MSILIELCDNKRQQQNIMSATERKLKVKMSKTIGPKGLAKKKMLEKVSGSKQKSTDINVL